VYQGRGMFTFSIDIAHTMLAVLLLFPYPKTEHMLKKRLLYLWYSICRWYPIYSYINHAQQCIAY
jgi:hypothetical protein